MGQLYGLIQEHLDRQPYPATAADFARRIGTSRQTVLNWRKPAKLPNREHLLAISDATGVPYQRVLDAVLHDIGYLTPRQ